MPWAIFAGLSLVLIASWLVASVSIRHDLMRALRQLFAGGALPVFRRTRITDRRRILFLVSSVFFLAFISMRPSSGPLQICERSEAEQQDGSVLTTTTCRPLAATDLVVVTAFAVLVLAGQVLGLLTYDLRLAPPFDIFETTDTDGKLLRENARSSQLEALDASPQDIFEQLRRWREVD